MKKLWFFINLLNIIFTIIETTADKYDFENKFLNFQTVLCKNMQWSKEWHMINLIGYFYFRK